MHDLLRYTVGLALATFAVTSANAGEGDLDTTFAGDGTARAAFDLGSTPAGKADHLFDVVVQPDGKPILFGSVDDDSGFRRVGLARFSTAGALDLSFSGDGRENFAVDVSTPQAITLLPDARILVAARSDNVNFTYLARRAPDGDLENFPGTASAYRTVALPVWRRGRSPFDHSSRPRNVRFLNLPVRACAAA